MPLRNLMATHISLRHYLTTSPNPSLELTQAVESGLPLEDLNLLRERGLTFTEMAEVIPPPHSKAPQISR